MRPDEGVPCSAAGAWHSSLRCLYSCAHTAARVPHGGGSVDWLYLLDLWRCLQVGTCTLGGDGGWGRGGMGELSRLGGKSRRYLPRTLGGKGDIPFPLTSPHTSTSITVHTVPTYIIHSLHLHSGSRKCVKSVFDTRTTSISKKGQPTSRHIWCAKLMGLCARP